jgi:hypothetical protein
MMVVMVVIRRYHPTAHDSFKKTNQEFQDYKRGLESSEKSRPSRPRRACVRRLGMPVR